MAKKITVTILLLMGLSLLTILVNTFRFRSSQLVFAPAEPTRIDNSVAERLAKAVQIKTISYTDTSRTNYNNFLRLHAHLHKSFPLTHQQLTREVINNYSLLYTWPGSDKSLKPAILVGHMDVVPVEPESRHRWKQAPFSGKIADGYIWGRGTLDDKGAILGMLEAVEHLLEQGFKPKRTILFAFGHDEETQGTAGAGKIVEHLYNKHIEAEFALDEGMIIAHGMVPGIQQPVALVGTSEKGYLSIKLTVQHQGGHSSTPAPETAIGILTQAVSRLQSNPMPIKITAPIQDFFAKLGPEMDFPLRSVFANRRLFNQVVIEAYRASPAGNAMLQNTTTPTIIRAGTKDNVVPSYAEAIVNCRLLPQTSYEDVFAHLNNIINDSRVKLETYGSATLASAPSGVNTFGYRVIEKSVRELSPHTLVAPSLLIASADARFYTKLSPNIYRFLPVSFLPDDVSKIHGINERIAIDNYKQSIRYYIRILINASEATLGSTGSLP